MPGASSRLGPIGLVLALLTTSSAAISQAIDLVPKDERLAIEEITSLAKSGLVNRYPLNYRGVVRRDAHAKSHGCVKATFEVEPTLHSEFRVGTFALPGQRMKAWIRFSNGAFEPGSDTGYDGRGLALKLMGQDPADISAAAPAIHDILMINHPVFFSPNARDYLAFARAGAMTGNTTGLMKYFVLGGRFRQGGIAYAIASRKIGSPLFAQYYSMVPFAFGPGRAAKYSARPCQDNHLQTGPKPATAAAPQGLDFLGEMLTRSLANGPACLELLIQERKGDMAIEDATVEWSESVSPYVRIGRIDLPMQNIAAIGREEFCENVTFNPWRAPSEHVPLGGINRIRRSVYDEIASYRHSRNKVQPPDPVAAWNQP